MTNTRLLTLFVCLLAAAVSIEYFNNSTISQDKPWTLVPVFSGNIQKTVSVSGTILTKQGRDITAKYDGQVDKVYHHLGDYVNKGEPLFSVTPKTTDVLLAADKDELAILKNAELEKEALYEKAKQDFSAGKLDKAKLEQAKNSFEASRIKRQKAQQDLTLVASGKALVDGDIIDTVVVSPNDGYITAMSVHQGLQIDASNKDKTKLITISDPENLYFNGLVATNPENLIRTGMPLKMILTSASEEQLLSGQVRLIQQVTKQSKLPFGYQLVIEHLKLLSKGSLQADGVVMAKLVIKEARDALIVPRHCVYFSGEKAYVYVPVNGDKAQRREIETGIVTPSAVQVVKGLHHEEQIVDMNFYQDQLPVNTR